MLVSNEPVLPSESSLFGVPLAALLENDQKIKANTSTPLFLQAVRISELFLLTPSLSSGPERHFAAASQEH